MFLRFDVVLDALGGVGMEHVQFTLPKDGSKVAEELDVEVLELLI